MVYLYECVPAESPPGRRWLSMVGAECGLQPGRLVWSAGQMGRTALSSMAVLCMHISQFGLRMRQ